MLKLNHKNLAVWDKSLKLIKEVYKLTGRLPKEEQYVLTSQLRRAAVSVASKSQRGCQEIKVERRRFYQISRSSSVEIDTQIEICKLLEYFKDNELIDIDAELNNVFALLTAMINNTK